MKGKSIDEVMIQKIIQIIESRTDLTPAEYAESRETWLSKILEDEDLTKDLIALWVNKLNADSAILKFVTSVNTPDDFPPELRK